MFCPTYFPFLMSYEQAICSFPTRHPQTLHIFSLLIFPGNSLVLHLWPHSGQSSTTDLMTTSSKCPWQSSFYSHAVCAWSSWRCLPSWHFPLASFSRFCTLSHEFFFPMLINYLCVVFSTFVIQVLLLATQALILSWMITKSFVFLKESVSHIPKDWLKDGIANGTGDGIQMKEYFGGTALDYGWQVGCSNEKAEILES